jgi:hypothetical protein
LANPKRADARAALRGDSVALKIVTDLPQELPITDAELELLESYLGDVLAEMLREPS